VAKNIIPNPMERRQLLEKSMDAKAAVAIADTYLDADRPVEAIDFLSKAGAEDRLEALGALAIEAGDAFLLKSVHDALGVEEPRIDDWERLASAAEAAGRDLYAKQARRAAGAAAKD